MESIGLIQKCMLIGELYLYLSHKQTSKHEVQWCMNYCYRSPIQKDRKKQHGKIEGIIPLGKRSSMFSLFF